MSMKNIKTYENHESGKELLRNMKGMDLAPKFDQISKEDQEKYVAIARKVLEDTLYCMRDWSAWGHKTMDEDDFVNCNEDDDLVWAKAEIIYNEFFGLE